MHDVAGPSLTLPGTLGDVKQSSERRIATKCGD